MNIPILELISIFLGDGDSRHSYIEKVYEWKLKDNIKHARQEKKSESMMSRFVKLRYLSISMSSAHDRYRRSTTIRTRKEMIPKTPQKAAALIPEISC
jgi:hypothetical protein